MACILGVRGWQSKHGACDADPVQRLCRSQWSADADHGHPVKRRLFVGLLYVPAGRRCICRVCRWPVLRRNVGKQRRHHLQQQVYERLADDPDDQDAHCRGWPWCVHANDIACRSNHGHIAGKYPRRKWPGTASACLGIPQQRQQQGDFHHVRRVEYLRKDPHYSDPGNPANRHPQSRRHESAI